MPKADIKIILNPKQLQAYKELNNDVARHILYGGGVGSGKSFIACFDAVTICLKYPGARNLLSRAQYSDFQFTTLKTLKEMLKTLKLRNKVDYSFNMTTKTLKFKNGSEIVFPHLEYMPDDPDFERLNGFELTRAYVDEGSEIHRQCFNVLRTRVGRCEATNNKVKPKILITSNPKKCWLKEYFVLPHKNGTISEDTKYIFANYLDNSKNLTNDYIDAILSIEDDLTRSRLVDGNWDYDDSNLKIFDYNSLNNMFGKVYIELIGAGKKYITIDVARFGKDLTVIGIWQGDYLYYIETIKSNSIEELYNRVRSLQAEHNIPNTQVVADEDGVGGGLVDFLKCWGFKNNSVSENYQNLKTQCIFQTAKLINEGALFIKDCQYKEQIISEFDKYRKVETNDGKLKCTDKKTLKVLLGRSPDFSDMIIMRRFFDEAEVKPGKTVTRPVAYNSDYEVFENWYDIN